MKSETRHTAHARRHPRLRRRGAPAAVICCLAFGALMLGAPAGAATSYRARGAPTAPAQGGVTPSDRSHSSIAPLTLATFDVTNLATGETDVSSTQVVTPSTGCAQNQSFICLTTGLGG